MKTVAYDPRDPSVRNWFINGGMDIWQRRTSQGSITVQAVQTVDRFQQVANGGLAMSSDRVTDVPTLAQSGYPSVYAHRLTITTPVASPAASDFYGMQYRMEGYDFANIANKKGFIKFWVKASVTGTYSLALAAGQDSTRCWVYEYSIPVANTWTQIKIPADFTGYAADPADFALAGALGLFVSWCIGAGTNRKTSTLNTWVQDTSFRMGSTNQTNLAGVNGATFLFTQVQLNLTEDAGFSLYGGDISGEVRACQRYFEKSYLLETPIDTNDGGVGCEEYISQGSQSEQRSWGFRTTKRTNPTIALKDPSLGSPGQVDRARNVTANTQVFLQAEQIGTRGFGTQTAIAAGQIIRFHWTAECEY